MKSNRKYKNYRKDSYWMEIQGLPSQGEEKIFRICKLDYRSAVKNATEINSDSDVGRFVPEYLILKQYCRKFQFQLQFVIP